MEKAPDAFRTIGEVSDLLETPAHVLRFWESRFPQIKPVKRTGGRRYYRPADVSLLAGLRQLLHDDGMTIKGVQKILREQGVRYVSDLGEQCLGGTPSDPRPHTNTPEIAAVLAEVQSLQPPAPVLAPVIAWPGSPAAIQTDLFATPEETAADPVDTGVLLDKPQDIAPIQHDPEPDPTDSPAPQGQTGSDADQKTGPIPARQLDLAEDPLVSDAMRPPLANRLRRDDAALKDVTLVRPLRARLLALRNRMASASRHRT